MGAPDPARPVVAGAALDVDLHVDVTGDLRERIGESLTVIGLGEQYAEDESAAQQELFDVEHFGAVSGGGGEHARGHASVVAACEGDDQCPCVRVGLWLYRWLIHRC